MVEVYDSQGYCVRVGRTDKDGNLFDSHGYNIGRVGEEKRLELRLAKIREERGEKQKRIPWTDR